MRKLKKYILCNFLITYLSWGIIIIFTQTNHAPFSSSILMLILYICGVLGPVLAAIIVTKSMDSKEKFHIFLKNCIIPLKNYKWYAIILIVTAIFQLLPFYLFGGEKTGPLYLIVLQLPLFVLIGGLEEVGWRGLMQPEMEKKFSPFLSTLMIGVVWTLWHLPLFFIIGTYQYEYLNFFTFTMNTVSLAFILSVIYHNTRSIFMCILTHTLLNSISSVFVRNESLAAELLTLMMSLVIFYLSYLINQHNRNKPSPNGVQ